MKKENLLRLIDRSIETEDRVVTQLSGDVSSALEWCGCPSGGKAKVKEMLSTIGNDSKGHAAMLAELRTKIESSKKRDF